MSSQFILPAASYGTSEIGQKNSTLNDATLIENTTVPIIDNRSSGRIGGITIEDEGNSEIRNKSSELAAGRLLVSPQKTVEMPVPSHPPEREFEGILRRLPTAIPENKTVVEFSPSLLNNSNTGISPLEHALAGATKQIVTINEFRGRSLSDSNTPADPPDPAIAVGPNHIVQMVNLAGQVTTKDNKELREFFLENFFNGGSNRLSDPAVVYRSIEWTVLCIYR